MSNEVTLSVGSSEESVYLLRAVAASIAARLDFSLDEIDDLTLAVSEAAAFLIAQSVGSTRLSMRVSTSGSGVETTVWVTGRSTVWPPPSAENGLAWTVLSALADNAGFVVEPEGPGIRLVKEGSSGRDRP